MEDYPFKKSETTDHESSSEEIEFRPPYICTTENLVGEGKLKSERIMELRDAFDKSIKDVRQLTGRGYDPEEADEELFEVWDEMDKRFNEAATVLLNTLDVIDRPSTIGGFIFFNLRQLLRKANDYSHEITSLGDIYERIIRSSSKIELCLKARNMQPLASIVLMLSSPYGEQQKAAMEFLVNHLPLIESHLKTDLDSEFHTKHLDIVSSVLIEILNSTDSVTQDRVLNLIKELLMNSNTGNEGIEIVNYITETGDLYLCTKIEPILVPVFIHYGIDEETANKWLADWFVHPTTKAICLRKNLENVIRLEIEKPGLSKFLYEKYGITEFGRYPVKMLIEQAENVENIERPYGVAILPRDDWNGAFQTHTHVFKELSEDVKENPDLRNYLIRIFECGSKKDIARALIELDKKYGQSHKIAFAIIGGHGTKDSINFGSGGPRHYLFSKDLHRSRTQKTGDFFEPNATVILASCSTGQNEGIGQTLSEKFGMKVIAPSIPTGVKRITPKFVNGRIDFDVEYHEKDTEMVYAEGKRVYRK